MTKINKKLIEIEKYLDPGDIGSVRLEARHCSLHGDQAARGVPHTRRLLAGQLQRVPGVHDGPGLKQHLWEEEKIGMKNVFL